MYVAGVKRCVVWVHRGVARGPCSTPETVAFVQGGINAWPLIGLEYRISPLNGFYIQALQKTVESDHTKH